MFSKKKRRKVDAGVQETLSTKLREEIQQLRMNHDSKHLEIDTEVKAKEPRRAMEQVLELDPRIFFERRRLRWVIESSLDHCRVR